MAPAACTGGGVASLGGQAAGQASHNDAAKAMLDCLADKDLPFALERQGDGRLGLKYVSSEADETLFLWSRDDGVTVSMSGVEDPEEEQAWSEQIAGRWRNPANGRADNVLWIGGVDHTAIYRQCAQDSGYTHPGEVADPALELAEKQGVAKAGAEWAACAREHGFPGVADPPPPVADNNATRPQVVIDFEVTPDQLRQLAADCPTWDKAAAGAYVEALNQGVDPDELPPVPYSPEITVEWELYGWDVSVGAEADSQRRALDRINELESILRPDVD
jgi:hypothetical protein